MVLYSTAQYFHLKHCYLWLHSPLTIRRDIGQCQEHEEERQEDQKIGRKEYRDQKVFIISMDKVSRGPRDNRTNGQRVISSTQGQGLLNKNGQFELVSEEGPSC